MSCFLFSLCLFCFWCAFSFPLFGGGGKEIRAPQYDFCIVGDRIRTLCLKAGKWARCHSPSGCMQWDSKYETHILTPRFCERLCFNRPRYTYVSALYAYLLGA